MVSSTDFYRYRQPVANTCRTCSVLPPATGTKRELWWEALKASGDVGDAGDAGETSWMLWRRATPCGQACYLWSLPLRQKMNYPINPIMHLQHNSINVVRQYIETSQQCKMETTKIMSSIQLYSQSDKHVFRLAASSINNDRHSRSGRDWRWFGRLQSIKRVSPALPALPASPDVFSITGCDWSASHTYKQSYVNAIW